MKWIGDLSELHLPDNRPYVIQSCESMEAVS